MRDVSIALRHDVICVTAVAAAARDAGRRASPSLSRTKSNVTSESQDVRPLALGDVTTRRAAPAPPSATSPTRSIDDNHRWLPTVYLHYLLCWNDLLDWKNGSTNFQPMHNVLENDSSKRDIRSGERSKRYVSCVNGWLTCNKLKWALLRCRWL